MDLRRELTRKVERKETEIEQWRREKDELDAKIREALSYIAALSETLKLLPKEMPSDAAKVLRPDSAVAKARGTILRAGKPLHIDEILSMLGKPVNHDTKAALSGSIASYVRKGEIFTRPAPNTFGLLELEHRSAETGDEEEPPADFGVVINGKPKSAGT